MAITMEEARIKNEMLAITNKWKKYTEKSGEPPKGSLEYIRRGLDRMRWQELNRKLKKTDTKNTTKEPEDIVEVAKQIFGIDE